MYLQSRSPHRVLGNITPEEAISGEKPQSGNFCIFGFLTYSHVPKERRTKLEPIVEKAIFVGYSETSKSYRIYIPSLRRFVVRRDVKFEEDKHFHRSQELDQVEPSTT